MLFPNDLFSTMGTEIVTARAIAKEAIEVARHLGYQADDRASLERALDRIAPMHGPTLTGHFRELISAFRENSPAHAA
jgi:flavorubredoxin